MKAIIYAGIGLFSVASVYGIADYYQSQKSGKLDGLYRDEKTGGENGPLKTVEKKEPLATVIPVPGAEKQDVEVKLKKSPSAEKKIRMEDFSRGRIEEKQIREIILEETPKENIQERPVQLPEVMPEPEKTAAEPERKLSLEMFSRAPLKKTVKQMKSKAARE